MSHETRMKKLELNNKCSIKGKPFKKLNIVDTEFVFDFLKDNKRLTDSAFKGKANFLFLSKLDRPKNHAEIVEVLMMTCRG